MNLLYINWGTNHINYMQSIFSITTAFRYKDCIDKCFIMTDHPEYYDSIKDEIEIIKITQQQIDDWMGAKKFVLNIKIKGIELFHNLHPDKYFMFVDSDTFFYSSPKDIFTSLTDNPKCAYLHLSERSYGDRIKNNKNEKALFDKLSEVQSDYPISETTVMYNSGVIALQPHDMQETLNDIYKLTNQFLDEGIKSHYLEQLAFSAVLQKKYDLQTCGNVIGHYWGNKQEWNPLVASFVVEGLIKKYTINDYINILPTIDFNRPVVQERTYWNIKFVNLMYRLFPNRAAFAYKK